MNNFRTSERLSGLLAFALSCIFYTAAGVLVIFLARSAAVKQKPAMGPMTLNVNNPPQNELKAAEAPPPEPVPVLPEKADVAQEEIPEKPEPEPVPAPAQVVQEAAAPATPVEAAEPLAGTIAKVDWRGIAVAKVRAMVEREKYYPAAAENAGYTGWCRVRVHLALDGTVAGYEVEKRHGHPLLGRAVETTLGRIQGQNIGIELPQSLDVPLTIEFELN